MVSSLKFLGHNDLKMLVKYVCYLSFKDYYFTVENSYVFLVNYIIITCVACSKTKEYDLLTVCRFNG